MGGPHARRRSTSSPICVCISRVLQRSARGGSDPAVCSAGARSMLPSRLHTPLMASGGCFDSWGGCLRGTYVTADAVASPTVRSSQDGRRLTLTLTYDSQQHARRPSPGPATPCPNAAASHGERCEFPGGITTCRQEERASGSAGPSTTSQPSAVAHSGWQSPGLNENASRRAKISRPRGSETEFQIAARFLSRSLRICSTRFSCDCPQMGSRRRTRAGARQCSWANVARGVWTANTGALGLAAHINCTRTEARPAAGGPPLAVVGSARVSNVSARAANLPERDGDAHDAPSAEGPNFEDEGTHIDYWHAPPQTADPVCSHALILSLPRLADGRAGCCIHLCGVLSMLHIQRCHALRFS